MIGARRFALVALVVLGVGVRAAWILAQVSTPAPELARADDRGWFREASRLLAHGKPDDAAQLARTRPADDPDARVVLARVALRSGRNVDALALLEPAAAADPTGEAALELAALYRAIGREEPAALLFERVSVSAGAVSDAAGLARAARASAALGEFRQANQLFRRASRAAAGDPAVETAWGLLFLDKHNQEDAARSFGEAIKADPEWAPAHAALGRALADANPPAAAEALRRALAIDPNLLDAHLTLARIEFDAGRKAEARAALDRALAIDPSSLEARAFRAAIARVEDRLADFDAEAAAILRDHPRYASAYAGAADLLARNYRFDEAVAAGRKAIEIDPSDATALAQLGMNLMRTGDEPEARRALDAAFRIDPYDVVTYNLLALLDTLDEFDTLEDGALVFKLHKAETPVLREYAPALAKEALTSLSQRYGITPRGPLLIEIFPRHDDFAVRTLGLPGLLGALGACFGRVVTLDSPKARPPNTFSWQATLWHELAHVITLQLSNQRVPRWLTEGISVFEERRARPEWGREMEVTFARAWRDGKAIPVRDLNAAFTKPETIALAYYQASLLVDHLVTLRGEAGLIALLQAYGAGLDDEPALQRAFAVSIDALQASFDVALKARFDRLAHALRDVPGLKGVTSAEALQALAVQHADSFAVQLSLGQALAAAGDRPAAMVAFERAATLVPQAIGPDSPRAHLAKLAQDAGDHARAARELAAHISVDHTNIDAARMLLATAERLQDARATQAAAARIVALDPFDSAAHSVLGRAALAAGDHVTASREFTAALITGPADPAVAHCELGEAHLAAGRAEDAKREALASLEVAPLFERAQELLLRSVEGRP